MRLYHIDNAKAVGMSLIIASHVWITPTLSESAIFVTWNAILNSFYVPLFFILSGVFEPTNHDWRKYINRLFKIAIYIVIFIIFGILTTRLIHGEWLLKSCIHSTLVWFLITLLWITAIFGLIKRANRIMQLIMVLCIGGGILTLHGHTFGYIGQALVCIPFYAIGYFGKEFFKRSQFNPTVFISSLCTWLIVTVSFYKAPQNLSLNMVSQNYISFYISAITGSIALIEICRLVNCNVISWYGRNSIVPMLVQMILIYYVSKIIIADNMGTYLLISLSIILLCGIFIPVFRNKYYDIFR